MLTIAIPVYNGGQTIGRLLDSISGNLVSFPEVEVIILNNASGDNTLHVVEGFKSKIVNLKVITHDVNIGPDLNFIRCVELAKHDYVWIIGDDDIMAAGAVSDVLTILQTQHNLSAIVCNYSLRPDDNVEVCERVINLFNDKTTTTPLELVNAAGLHMNFLSSTIHSREKFLSVNFDRYKNTYWLQLGVFLEYAANGLVYIINKPIIVNAGNRPLTIVNDKGFSVQLMNNMIMIVAHLKPLLGNDFFTEAMKFVYPNLLRKLYIGKRTGYMANRSDYEFFIKNIPEGAVYKILFQVAFISPPWVSKIFFVLYKKLRLRRMSFNLLFK